MSSQNVFDIENRIDDLFEAIYPKFTSGQSGHPSGRACRTICTSALGAMVPDSDRSRRLQHRREYIKVDFPDFVDYATSQLPPVPCLRDFADQTAVFFDSITSDKSTQWALWGHHTFAIKDAVVARDRVFVTVMMRFNVCFNSEAGNAQEFGATITFAPESYSVKTQEAGPLGEWERSMWFPPTREDVEFRFIPSGEYTSHQLEEMETKPDPGMSQASLAKVRDHQRDNHTTYGAFFEVARLGLHLHSYVDFMYDLVVTERKPIGVKRPSNQQPRRGKHIAFDRPVYKIIRSVRVIRPESPPSQQSEFRQWTAPSYSFIVRGHWRHFEDSSRQGRDANGEPILGKTWVREHRKFEELGHGECESRLESRDPQIVIGIKQTLRYARDLIAAEQTHQTEEVPSAEWMADERAKLTAALRYLILKRDGFRCCKCGKSPSDENHVRLEVDHKTPVSRWGRTVEENLETLCRDCNRGKSNS